MEFIDMTGLFMGIGGMVLLGTASYLLYKFVMPVIEANSVQMDKQIKYDLFEILGLDKLASKKGFDLNKELLTRRVLAESKIPKNTVNRMKDQVYNDLFPTVK